MVSLHPNDVRGDLEDYCTANNINLFKCDIKYNQDPFVVMSNEAMQRVLDFVQNPENQPTLIFCTGGKVRTGCAVGCLRKKSNWCMSSIVQEFEQYTEPDGGLCDLHFIESFE
jgi:protein tyrosine/serine phosphatase